MKTYAEVLSMLKSAALINYMTYNNTSQMPRTSPNTDWLLKNWGGTSSAGKDAAQEAVAVPKKASTSSYISTLGRYKPSRRRRV